MSCSLEEKRQLVDAAKMNLRRLGKLREAGHLVDTDGNNTDVEESIESMYGIAQGNMDKIKQLKPYRDITSFVKDQMKYPDGIAFFSKGKETTQGDHAIKSLYERDGEIVVVTKEGWQFSIPNGQMMSKPSVAGHRVQFARIVDVREALSTPGLGNKKTETTKVNWKDFDRSDAKIHGDVDLMVGLLNELHTMDGGKETAEHMEQLTELFRSLDPKFFTKMTTFVKETAEKSAGVIEGKRLGITASKIAKIAGNDMGAAEIYAHEVIHSVTMFALEQAKSGDWEARKLVRELEYVMESAKERMTWKDLMPEVSIDKAAEEVIAKEMYQYIFTDENAKAEFIAHALTHPAMMSKLKKMNVKVKHETKTILETIAEWLGNVVDLIMGKYTFGDRDKTTHEEVLNLAMRLGEINNEKLNRLEDQQSVATALAEMIDTGNMAIHDTLQEVIKKYGTDEDKMMEARPQDTAGRVAWTMKYLGKVMRNDVQRNYFGQILSAYGIAPEGWVRDWARAFGESSDLQQAAEWLGTTSDNIDRIRNTMVSVTKRAILDEFKNPISEDEDKALTRVLLDTDVQSLYDGDKYSMADIAKMLRDDEELNRRISRAKYALKEIDPDHYNWNVTQANGLGIFMATHESSIAQNLNAENIVKGIMSSNRRKLAGKEEIVKLVDEVATLTALRRTSTREKTLIAELIKKERNGVENVINTHKGFVKDSRAEIFEHDSAHMIKGYTKEIFDDKIAMEIAPVHMREEMGNKGFTFRVELDKSKHDSAIPMAIYTSEAFITDEYHRAATRMTSMSTKGTAFAKVHAIDGDKFGKERAELDKVRTDKDRAELVKQMEAGELDMSTVEMGVTPIIDQYGNVVDYRYTMNKHMKEELLGQTVNATDALSRSFGSVIDKKASNEHNGRVLESILSNMKEDWIPGTTTGKDGLEYVLIGPESTVEDAKEIYRLLPPIFKNAINKHPNKTLAVPRELMHLYFGYRHLSIVDFPGLKYITPAVVRNIIKIVEAWWIEAIKLVKASVLLKMPFVLVGNIVSNIVYAIMTGNINPMELWKDYRESFRDVRKYIRQDRELAGLTVKVKSGKATQADKERIKIIELEMNDSPIKELMDLGLYQAVVEDVENMNMQSSNKWKQVADEKLKNVPSFIKTPLQWAYLSSDTAWYKVNQEVLQMSDLMARDIENRRKKKMEKEQVMGQRKLPKWWRDKHGDGKLPATQRKVFLGEAKKMRHYGLLENYVNYNKPASKLEEYLNRVGLVMFTKYTKNIQKVIAKSTYTHPINALLILLGQSYLLDVDTIQDQSLFTRSWYNFGYGGQDVLPGMNPLDHIMSLVTPALIKPTTYQLY
ncbi:MAG: hypothetical protein ACYDD5_00720 [Sulfuricurvum sp.]